MTARDWMTDDPKLEGIALLMLDRIAPALHHARNYGDEAFPDLDECTLWTNGSIFGVVAAFVTLNYDEAGLEEITKVSLCICDMINETIDRYGRFDLDHYATDFLKRVGVHAEKEVGQ